MSSLSRLSLTDFRSYAHAELALDGRPVALWGPNGAGKTNLLEAISLLTPGRGLRNAAAPELGRRDAGEASGRAWAVAAQVDGEHELGTGLESPTSARRTVRLDGQTVPPGRMAEFLRLVWLTPQQDRLFLEGAAERRRFFDRLVFAAVPIHAAHVSAYDKAMRERTVLLTAETPADPAWLNALEAGMAEAGTLMMAARRQTLAALQEEIDSRTGRPFPQAGLAFDGEWLVERDEAQLAQTLAQSRDRDAAAGRALAGPHRGDLAVIHRDKGRPAAESSTGEQKALILNLVLAQAARLSRAESAPRPILLLDEVAAHLDPSRRSALFDEIESLRLQAFLTGTEAALFSGLQGRAQAVRVDDGRLTATETV
jgi:DNA replication and repair protein RecF